MPYLTVMPPLRLILALSLGIFIGLAAPALSQEAGETEAPVAQDAPAGAVPVDIAPAPAPSGDMPVPEAPPGEAAADTPAPLVGVPTGLGHDLSPWGMFMAADLVVKAVMVGLFTAFVVTLVIWLAKTLELWGARSRARQGLDLLARAERLEDAIAVFAPRAGAVALMVRAAEDETRLTLGALDHAGGDGLKERVSSRLSRLVAGAGRRLSRGTGILATVGAVAPFVGLFGTVWGIMNSFIGIAETQTTNLAVVAPGIAEALLATALGLVAAIPAVVIYNGFARAVTGYRQMLVDAASTIERLVSRDLDWRAVPTPALPAAATAQPREQ